MTCTVERSIWRMDQSELGLEADGVKGLNQGQ